jgi:cell division protein ZapB
MNYMQNATLLVDAFKLLPHSAGCVDNEFTSLEAKIARFVSLCERLRAENVELRQQLAAARSDAKRLHEKIDGAKARLEGLLARLPG